MGSLKSKQAFPTASDSIEDLINQQLNAYNSHDIDKFLAFYTEDITVYMLKDGSVYLKGKGAMREVYSQLFAKGKVAAVVPNRIHIGRYIVDEEMVTDLWLPEAGDIPKAKAIAHYAVNSESMLIETVWFWMESD